MEETARETAIVPGDWVTLASVIVELATGIISFLYTGSIQRRRYRHQLLPEMYGILAARVKEEVHK